MCGEQFGPNPWSHQCHPHHTDGETETCRLIKSPDTACAPTVRGLCWALWGGRRTEKATHPAGFKSMVLPCS